MRSLKVLLLKPYSQADELIPPVGLGYLATAIREQHQVTVLDGIKEKLTLEKFSEIVRKGNFEVIGIQIFTFHLSTVKDYLKIIRQFSPQTKIIIGGPHPSCEPRTIFNLLSDIDFAFRGEAEVGLKLLLNFIAENTASAENLKQVPGLIWRQAGQTIINEPVFVKNLDELGLPAWDLLKPDTYPLSPHGAFFKKFPIAPITVTRGCPFPCTYCAAHLVSGKPIRSRSVKNVIQEIELLYNQYGIREIHIEDDNFTLNKNFVKEFCQTLINLKLDLAWACPNGIRLDTLDEEILNLMKKSGLYVVSVGVESGSQRILDSMQKRLTKEQIRNKIHIIRKVGLEVIGFFIIGYPAETKADILETFKFAESLDLKRANYMIFHPYPGTPITNKLIESGELKIDEQDWEKYILADVAYSPPGISKRQLKNLRRLGFLRFYLRPKILIKMLREIKSPKHFLTVFKRIFKWLVK